MQGAQIILQQSPPQEQIGPQNPQREVIEVQEVQDPQNHLQEVRCSKTKTFLFISALLCQAYTAAQPMILLETFQKETNWKFSFNILIIMAIIRIVIWSLCIYFWRRGRRFEEWRQAFYEIDILTILCCCNGVASIALQLAFTIHYREGMNALAISSYVLIFMVYFLYIGNFKLMVRMFPWQRWHYNLYKLRSLLSCLGIMAIGIYFSFFKLNNDDCKPCIILYDLPDHEVCQMSCKKASDCCYDQDNFLKTSFSTINQFFILLLAMGLAYTAELTAVLVQYLRPQFVVQKPQIQHIILNVRQMDSAINPPPNIPNGDIQIQMEQQIQRGDGQINQISGFQIGANNQ